MAQYLTLTTPITFPSITTWEIMAITLDRRTPSIKALVRSNTGEQRAIAYVPDPDDPDVVQTIWAGLRFINDGNFRLQGKTLQRWLLEQFAQDGKLDPGTVTGTPDTGS